MGVLVKEYVIGTTSLLLRMDLLHISESQFLNSIVDICMEVLLPSCAVRIAYQKYLAEHCEGQDAETKVVWPEPAGLSYLLITYPPNSFVSYH